MAANVAAHPLRTPLDVLRMVNTATIWELADAFGAEGGDLIECPQCHVPHAALVVEFPPVPRWSCTRCDTSGTVVDLAQRVASDSSRLALFLGQRGAAA